MALRLAHFVRTGVVEPEEALGITFTNKAAGELADRLRTTLPEAAAEGREVEVTTYHGFAHGLLREFGSLVGTAREGPHRHPGLYAPTDARRHRRCPTPVTRPHPSGKRWSTG